MPEAGTGPVLAFDFGEKRIGIAVGDCAVGIAHPLEVIEAEDNDTRFARIAALVDEWRPARFVVGLPLREDGGEQPATRLARRFGNRLHGRFGVPVILVDERYTTLAAESRLREAGVRRRPLHADSVAACEILDSYFSAPPADGRTPVVPSRDSSVCRSMPSTPLPDAERLLEALTARMRPEVSPETGLIGIHTGGVWLAERLHAALGLQTPLATLDVAFYRDDYASIGLHRDVKRSQIPFDVVGRPLILVDDVLYTGRTIRAAMNEIFDYGRPASIRLAALIDRGGRELPVAAQFVGAALEVPAGRGVELKRGDDGRLTLAFYDEPTAPDVA